MVDWAYVGGMADDTGNDADHESHDPEGRCGPVFGARWHPVGRALTEPVTCNRCGAKNLKWRIADGGRWALFENTRVQPGNYKPEHLCPTTADGFEEVL